MKNAIFPAQLQYAVYISVFFLEHVSRLFDLTEATAHFYSWAWELIFSRVGYIFSPEPKDQVAGTTNRETQMNAARWVRPAFIGPGPGQASWECTIVGASGRARWAGESWGRGGHPTRASKRVILLASHDKAKLTNLPDPQHAHIHSCEARNNHQRGAWGLGGGGQIKSQNKVRCWPN